MSAGIVFLASNPGVEIKEGINLRGEDARSEDARPFDKQVKPIDNDPIAVHLNV
jgi:hypothetical protein